jgi:hypothetical protein
VIPRVAAAIPTTLAILVTACGAPAPSPSPPAPSWAPIESGHPFDADAILTLMRESRRPGGVPDEIETPAIAAEIAETVATFDGNAWSTASVGGSCGPSTCTLDVSGSRSQALGEDVWTFSVEPATGEVSVIDSQLGSVPADVAGLADQAVRASSLGAQVAELVIGSVGWLPPPDGRLVLAYRSGEEEESCRRDVSVDMTSGSVRLEREGGC